MAFEHLIFLHKSLLMWLCKAAKVHEPQIKQTNICAMKTIFFKRCSFAQFFCTQKGENVKSKAVRDEV